MGVVFLKYNQEATVSPSWNRILWLSDSLALHESFYFTNTGLFNIKYKDYFTQI